MGLMATLTECVYPEAMLLGMARSEKPEFTASFEVGGGWIEVDLDEGEFMKLQEAALEDDVVYFSLTITDGQVKIERA